MDTIILQKAENINQRYTAFIEQCDLCEDSKRWDVEKYGQMETYIANELTCILLRLAASDGNISEEEVELYNVIMGAGYSVAELKDVYGELKDAICNYSVDGFVKDLAELKEQFPALMIEYCVIVTMACELLCECDGIVSEEEISEAKSLMAAIGI